MKGAEASAGENGYNPAEFIRGGVVGANDGQSEHDGAGLSGRQETHSCRLDVSGCEGLADGVHAVPYSWFMGQPFLRADKKQLRFTFGGKFYSGKEDEWVESEWQAVIDGDKNLETLYFHLAEAKQISIQKSKPAVRATEIQVDKIVVMELK